MTPLLTLFSNSAYLNPPEGWYGWLAWFGLALGVGYGTWLGRGFNRRLPGRRRSASAWFSWIILFVLTPLTSGFFGVQLTGRTALPRPGIPAEPISPVLMLFSALTWVLAAGMWGPTSAGFFGLLTGLIRAFWITHDPFTPLVSCGLAVLFSVLVRQDYRTRFFHVMRHPLAAGVAVSLVYPLATLIFAPFLLREALVSRLDYAFNTFGLSSLTFAAEVMLAALVGEVFRRFLPRYWPTEPGRQPAPGERSLNARFLINLGLLALVMATVLIAVNWISAGNVARTLLQNRMSTAAQIAAENIPYFLESGQSILAQIAADPRLRTASTDELQKVLAEVINTPPFFDQLTVLDSAGFILAGYPDSPPLFTPASSEEKSSIELARSGVPYQNVPIPPRNGENAVRISFIAAIFRGSPSGGAESAEMPAVQRILVAHTSLANNPFSRPLLSSLNSTAAEQGQGLLLDENGLILAHRDPDLLLTEYRGSLPSEAGVFESTAPDGTRLFGWYQPAIGRPWAVVLWMPASQVQQVALDIALPLLTLILGLFGLAFFMIQLGLKSVTASLRTLAGEANRLAQGKLEQAVTVSGVDEVGQFAGAFEQMRRSLKARLDELNSLLMVSQGVASSLDIQQAIEPVLASALSTGADLARLVLTPSTLPDLESPSAACSSFQAGPAQDLYHELDEQILNLARHQDRLVLSNTLRPRLLNFTPGAPRPESLLAVPLRHENQYYGALWIAFNRTHSFVEDEVRFLVTLAGQAALAAANSHLFLSAEIGRQRLAAILDSTPDPVIVTDQNDGLLLANPAAWQALGRDLELGAESADGAAAPIDKVIRHKELLEILRSSGDEKVSREITLPDGRIYLAAATAVLAEGRRVGRICLLRDVTSFKELDALKTEFVATVSHDLRGPLTLMRGYATMLEMVGQLNEQQNAYVKKIIGGVESMTRLVNNLLDLGRIEAGIGLALEMVPVQDVVERVVKTLQAQAAQKRIQLTTEIVQPTVPLIEADPALLQHALQNLVENAIKYTRPEGKVQVRVRMQPIGLVFEVSDNGIGISPMDLPRLFEKFYRVAQPGVKEQQGSGLGLAIVKSIAERHGGKAWAESQLGKGSTFYLALPLRQPKSEQTEVREN